MHINRILVTGGSGFIGSHFIRHMLSKYPEVEIVNIDNLSTGSLGNLSDLKNESRYHFVHADMREREVLDAVVSEGVDVVVNTAGLGFSPFQNDQPYVDANVGTLAGLLDYIAKYNSVGGMKVQRFIQLSTYEVYGTGKVKDTHVLDPFSRYAVSKASSDMECSVRVNDSKIPAIVLRTSEVYGAQQNIHQGLSALCTQKDRWLDMKFPYDTYEWLAVQDVANAIDILIHRGKVGEIYHAGSGEYLSIHHIQKAIHTGKIPQVSHTPDDYPQVSSADLRELGWKENVTFEDAFVEMGR
ncbi:MAG: GDP-mannose 4,6-dehydratase [bacterium]|nr:GDP-mannose 4,6-dehydratase [bacterium]